MSMKLYGIAEAPGLLYDAHFDGTRSTFPVLRPGEDIVEHIFRRHQELGVEQVIWQLGRSFLTYHTEHPLLTVQGSLTRAHGLEHELPPHLGEWLDYLERACPLRRALDQGAARNMPVWGWLCMNRNYSLGSGMVHASQFWVDNHEEMGEYSKTGERDLSRLCYGYPEYQEERLAAVLEAARATGPISGRHLDTIVLDFVRQPPILQYHPLLCDGYTAQGGGDPRQLQAQHAAAFLDWCRWRASLLSGFLRQVRAALGALGDQLGHRFRLVPRVTDLGPNINMIEGVDLRTWCAEGLIDGILTSPLNWARTVWEHDLRPYVTLAQDHAIPVIAGVCLNQQTRFHRVSGSVNLAVLARRVSDYQLQGASGIAFYQSECGLEFDDMDSVVPLCAEPGSLTELLADPAFHTRWPVTHLNCAYGLDCHSHFNNYTIDTEVSPM
jgi:hypothetical protein